MKKQFENKLSFFRHGCALYCNDVKDWLKRNTTPETECVTIGKVKNATQELHPLFFELIDEIIKACPKAKIILQTDGLFLNILEKLVYDYEEKVEIHILIKGYNEQTYTLATGRHDFNMIVENLRTLKAFCEYNRLNPAIKIYSPFFGDIEQACFVKMVEQFGSFTYL